MRYFVDGSLRPRQAEKWSAQAPCSVDWGASDGAGALLDAAAFRARLREHGPPARKNTMKMNPYPYYYYYYHNIIVIIIIILLLIYIYIYILIII